LLLILNWLFVFNTKVAIINLALIITHLKFNDVFSKIFVVIISSYSPIDKKEEVL